MFNFYAKLEDVSIAVFEQQIKPPKDAKLGRSEESVRPDLGTELILVCHDFLTGATDTRVVTHLQLGAIVALMFGGDDFSANVVDELYRVAEQALKECRPIP